MIEKKNILKIEFAKLNLRLSIFFVKRSLKNAWNNPFHLKFLKSN